MLVPNNVECIKNGLGTAKQQVRELRLAQRVQTDDLAVEHAAAAPEVGSESVAQSGKALESISIARDQPHAIVV